MCISARERGEPVALVTLPEQAGMKVVSSTGIKSLCWNCKVLV